MKKSLLSGLILAGSFLLFNNDALAAETSNFTNQPSESTDNIIYYNTDEQDMLITDEFIITTIEPSESLRNRNNPLGINTLNNGVWDLLGYETVFSSSSIWHSTGGDFKVEIEQTDFGPVFYQLKEQDTYIDNNVGQQFQVSGSKYFALEYRNISSYVDDDGVKGAAEFYMTKLTHKGNGYFMAFYD
ncbi:hypothetical protein ABIA69_000759 [Lysinibacillus parviboronicapiens]|uniref:Uncharacterized protein n=1 Tax=Lysinibacillus parviboronicapiens TaxID=436516 RepID=A0ABV2PF88_9BACI